MCLVLFFCNVVVLSNLVFVLSVLCYQVARNEIRSLRWRGKDKQKGGDQKKRRRDNKQTEKDTRFVSQNPTEGDKDTDWERGHTDWEKERERVLSYLYLHLVLSSYLYCLGVSSVVKQLLPDSQFSAFVVLSFF